MDTAQEFDIVQVGEPLLLKLLDIWNAARTDRNGMPRKSDIDIAALGEARLLPHTWLVEVPDDGEPFYRVAGDQIRTLFGTKMQNCCLSEVYNEKITAMLTERWRGMLNTGTFTHTAGLVYFDTHKSVEGERLAFPLSDDTDTPRYILGATFYAYSPLMAHDEGPQTFDQRVHSVLPIQSVTPP